MRISNHVHISRSGLKWSQFGWIPLSRESAPNSASPTLRDPRTYRGGQVEQMGSRSWSPRKLTADVVGRVAEPDRVESSNVVWRALPNHERRTRDADNFTEQGRQRSPRTRLSVSPPGITFPLTPDQKATVVTDESWLILRNREWIGRRRGEIGPDGDWVRVKFPPKNDGFRRHLQGLEVLSDHGLIRENQGKLIPSLMWMSLLINPALSLI